MDTKALRQKILDLAIHGKLVPQNPNDEPASVLLERIRTEKERLIKEGKIKKGKKSAKTSDKPHYPYELPEGWEWCKLDDLAFYKKGPFGSSLTKAMFVPKSSQSYKVYEQKNAIHKDYTLGSYYITKEKYDSLIGFAVQPYDIIVSCAGTIGETYVLPAGIQEGIINQALMVIRLFSKEIERFYLLYFDFILKDEAYRNSKGTAIKNIPPFDVLKNFFIPIPPIGEQKRILDEVDRWMSFVSTIETGARNLQTAIKQAKPKILDLAIHGKLVPQDPNDEPASELLKRINPKAEIISHNGHYQKLPEGWCVCHINEISESLLGKTLDRTKDCGEFKRYVCAVNVQLGYFDFTTQKRFRIEAKDFERYAVKKGDLLICEGGDVGRCAIWDTDTEMYYQNALHRVRCKFGISEKYLQYSLWHFKLNGVIDSLCKGVTIKHFTQSTMNKLEIPLPPFAEQQRIVAKIEELFHQFDMIEESL